jgi:Ca-activated chloride channel family protein
MTLSEEDLKKLLDNIRIPEPGDEVREKALKTAAAEYDRLKQAEQKKHKGFSSKERLTDKPIKGGSVMRKSFVITAGLAAGLAALIMVIMPNFMSYRTRGPVRETRQDFSMKQSAKPAPQAPPATFSGARPALKLAPQPLALYIEAEQSAGQKRPLTQEYVGRDQFETIVSNPVKRTAEEPVSTFSIDVDTASYAFVRRALNNGVLPQKNAVRIEELINYFDYDYPLPSDRKVPFKPTIAVFPTPWNPATQLLQIGIKGLDMVPGKRPEANLVFLIDVSGSMNSPDKLPLLKNAFRMLVETLEPEDTVAIVVYAGAAGTVLEPTRLKEKAKIIEALDRLSAGGSTAGGQGIRRAYALAEGNFNPKGVNRVILATDGDFNVGIRNPEELKGFVERKRKTGIFLSVLGFGQGNYNDALMQKLAQNGNGNAAYIDTLNEARKVLVEEAGATLFTIARDVKIQVEFNPARVAEYRLIGYETRMLRREDFNNDRVDAGDVGAGHSVTAIYEITPVGSSGQLIDELRYGGQQSAAGVSNSGKSSEYAFLKIRYKLPDTETSRLMTTPIGRSLEYSSIEKAPGEAVFAAAVAAFGQILRQDPHVKDFSYDDVLALAEPVRGKDRFGYRSEFLNLVRLAKTARAMGDR